MRQNKVVYERQCGQVTAQNIGVIYTPAMLSLRQSHTTAFGPFPPTVKSHPLRATANNLKCDFAVQRPFQWS